VILLTDFGHKDTFAGIMKGVIASISPESQVIDLSHGVDPGNILQASFFLRISYAYFPRKSVFCVVVDPGVGSNRNAVCIETLDYFFVGPDNGVLWEAASCNHIQLIVRLTNRAYLPGPVSNTFHGRDVFAPMAAVISKGLETVSVLGDPVNECVEFHLPKIKKNKFGLELSVLHIDRFGNLTLNLTEKEFRQFVQDREFCLTFKDCRIKKTYKAYSGAKGDEIFLIPASSGYMEISVKNGSAAKILDACTMDPAVLEMLVP
jgi:hypothetical protein